MILKNKIGKNWVVTEIDDTEDFVKIHKNKFKYTGFQAFLVWFLYIGLGLHGSPFVLAMIVGTYEDVFFHFTSMLLGIVIFYFVLQTVRNERKRYYEI